MSAMPNAAVSNAGYASNPDQAIVKILRAHTWRPGAWRKHGSCGCGWSQGSTGERDHPVHVAERLITDGVTRILPPAEMRAVLLVSKKVQEMNKKAAD